MTFAFTAKPNAKNLSILFIAAFLIRACTFYFYVQHEERYHQADSNDYHYGGLTLALGHGMVKQSGQPVFWRTPGYPYYLSKFYTYFGLKSAAFADNTPAHKAALWLQLILCSLIPIIIFFLAFSLLGLLKIAWIAAWISVFHVGLVLSSVYLLTEGLTLIFFYLFLLFFYKSFFCIGEYPTSNSSWKKNLILAALLLAIATWIRPMGEFVAISCAVLMFLFAQDSFREKFKKIGLFLLVFYACLAPWYIRNYQLTGKLFFCPMFGTYLNSFVAPKILRETHKVPFEQAWRYLQTVAGQNAVQNLPAARAQGLFLVPEHFALQTAMPILCSHPFLGLKVWMPEVFKTAFDLYSFQLIALANNMFKSDPLEEFLSEKIADTLYAKPAPWWMRIICWLDFIFTVWLWLSLFVGMFIFWILPLFKRFQVSPAIKNMAGFWLKTAFLSASIMFMTGGFGYARLRLPVEPLMIITALTLYCVPWKPQKNNFQ